MGAHHGRRGRAGAHRRPAGGAAPERRAAARNRRLRARDATTQRAADASLRPRLRYLRHGRRQRRHLQRLVRRRHRRRRVRRAGGETRQPIGVEPLRQRGSCSKRSASTSRRRPPWWSSCLAEAGIAFFFAPTFHPSMRHAAPVRRDPGHPHGTSACSDQPTTSRWRRQLVGVPRPELNGAGRARAGPAGLRARVGGSRRGRPRRNLHDRLHQGVGVQEAATCARSTCIRPTSACARRRPEELRGWRREGQRGSSCGACWKAGPARARDIVPR